MKFFNGNNGKLVKIDAKPSIHFATGSGGSRQKGETHRYEIVYRNDPAEARVLTLYMSRAELTTILAGMDKVDLEWTKSNII
jgi:hypothetical protein